MKNLKAIIAVAVVGVALSTVFGLAVVRTFSGNTSGTTIVNEAGGVINILGGETSESLGAFTGTLDSRLDAGEITAWNDAQFDDVVIEDSLWVDGAFRYFDTLTALTVTTTLAVTDSGETFLISGGSSVWTLPTTTGLTAGTNYMFRVGGDLTTTSTIVVSNGVNLIEGLLEVANAVVDCAAEDTITIGAGLENIGDYVELIWSGTYWLLGESSFLTTASATCTAT